MFDSISQLLNYNQASPIILLFGENEFSREEAQEALINKFVVSEDDKFNFDLIDGEDSNINTIVDLCRSYPMMSERRVVVVKRFEKLFSGRISKKIEESSAIANYLRSPSPDTILIAVADIDSVKDVYKTYKQNNPARFEQKVKSIKFPYRNIISNYVWMEFPRVYESEFPRWTRERFKMYGKTIQPEALDVMLSKTKHSLRDIGNEVEKLCIALKGKKEITFEDINFLTGATREYNVFELQKAIVSKDLAKSIMIIDRILSTDRQEMLILAILSKFFINALSVVEDFKTNASPQNLASKLGISPFQFNDYQTALKNYSIKELEKSIIALRDTDLELKSANSNSLLTMQKLLYTIIDRT